MSNTIEIKNLAKLYGSKMAVKDISFSIKENEHEIVVFPQIAARNAFQLHTATGKLNAVITPTIPNGCHCSYIL